jgi:hypothetical protein
LVAVPAASGQALVNNFTTPADYDINGWSISNGDSVTDSFTLSTESTVNGIAFVALTNYQNETAYPGQDDVTSIEWAISGSPFGGPPDSNFSGMTNTYEGVNTNGDGYDVFVVSFTIPDEVLAAGNYWLTLSNGEALAQDPPVWWNESDGPASAQDSVVGDIGSESFQILSPTDVPEGGSYSYLLLSGLALVGCGFFRIRKTGK